MRRDFVFVSFFFFFPLRTHTYLCISQRCLSYLYCCSNLVKNPFVGTPERPNNINISRIFGCTRGQHSIAPEAKISPIFGVSRQSVHFSSRFFIVGLPFARLTGPPPRAASAVPASSRGGVRKVRNAGPIPEMSPPVCHYTVLDLTILTNMCFYISMLNYLSCCCCAPKISQENYNGDVQF